MSPRRRAANTDAPTGDWPPPPHEVTSADGTVVRGYWTPHCKDASNSPTSTVVLAADLAEAVPQVWRPQVEYLGGKGGPRFVAWEYRDTRHVSDRERRPHGRYDVAAHLEDLCAVLQAAEVSADAPFAIIGSGVGVRVALEAALAMPQRVTALVLIGGAAGWRYAWLCRLSWLAATLAREAVGSVAARTRLLRARAALLTVVTEGVEQVMQLSEMSLLDRYPHGDAAETFVAVDAIAASLRELGTQPVVEQAGRVSQPALVLCGEADPRMPAAMAHQLARRLSHSRVKIVPRSASRLAASLPDFVNLEVERFFNELADSTREI